MADNQTPSPRNPPEQGAITATEGATIDLHGSANVEPHAFAPESVRTTRKTVTFSRPFLLSGIGGIQHAGTYTVETDEELMQELSFPAYRRTATLMLLPRQPGGVLAEIATIDPLELEVALERDAMMETSRSGGS